MKQTRILNGNIFIIPNGSFHVNDLAFVTTNAKLQMEHVFWGNKELNHNDVSFNDTRWIECWWCDPTDTDSNWRDHGIEELNKELPHKEQMLSPWRLSTSYVPTWIFEGRKEGDIVTFKMPIQKVDTENDLTINSIVKMSVKLAQKSYRYSSFGKFEEVLARV
jgi:hypothetical protein